MTDYLFLGLFESDLKVELNAFDLMKLTSLTKNEVNIKIDALLNSHYLTENNLTDIFRGESFVMSNRWLEDDQLPSEMNELFISTYSLTNLGLQFYEDEKFRRTVLSKRTKREWINIIISIFSLIIAGIALYFSLS